MNNDLITKMKGKTIPVLNINNFGKLKTLADFMTGNLISICEITFRTEYAAEAIGYLKSNYPMLTVGAGTVLDVETAKTAIEAGADFIVCPAIDESIISYCACHNILVIPGVETASDIQRAINCGIDFVKFFPAEAIGGVKKLKALSAPFYNIRFMPTGGINELNSKEYLSLPCVVCVGGTYVIPSELL